LRFLQPAADLGEIKAGVRLAHRFDFINDGPDRVDIVDLRPSCGCIVPALDPRTFQSGEKGVLRLEIRSLGEPAGMHHWNLQVISRTANASKEIQLHLTARVVAEISVQPPTMTAYADRALVHEIRVVDFRPNAMNVVAVHASSPGLQCKIGELVRDEAGNAVRIVKLEIRADLPDGRHAEAVHIQTDDPVYKELEIPVTIIKQSRHRVTAHPHEIVLGVHPGQLPSQTVLLRDRENQGVIVKKIVPDNPALVCKWVEGPGTHATVKITLNKATLAAESFQTTVRIELAGPVAETLLVPVSCTVQK
jgi:hypothetical protein